MNASLPPSGPVTSPCNKVCTLDARGVCLGCGRELGEIANWSRLTPAEQMEVCRRAAERRRQMCTSG